MARKRYDALVRSLSSAGYESPYLDRLRRRLCPEQAFEDLRTEIVRETAAALGRAAEKVDHALLRLELARDAVEAASSARARRAAVQRYNRVREEALQAKHEFVIHREAAGIRRNREIDEIYPIPAPLPSLPQRGRR